MRYFLSRKIAQSPSHNYPKESNDKLANLGKIITVLAACDKEADKESWLFLVEAIVSLFGNSTEGPGQYSILSRTILSSGRQ